MSVRSHRLVTPPWALLAALALAGCGAWDKPGLGDDACTARWFADVDGDGAGDASDVLTACTAPVGRVADDSDCDDASAAVHPDADEVIADGVDQDCSGADAITCFVDDDGDGHGSGDTLTAFDGACDFIAGEATLPDDCDDADPDFSPSAYDIPEDGVDQDCNLVDAVWCLADLDGDGFGLGELAAVDGSCDAAQGETLTFGDCDDSRADAFPGGTEVADDAVDQDCSGTDTISCYVDADLDGVGDAFSALAADAVCLAGTAPRTGDCDEARSDMFPGATEVADDAVDQDCSGADTVTCWEDVDLDGHAGTKRLREGVCLAAESATGDDCDDRRATVFPGAAERCDGVDTDCDPLTLEDGLVSNDADLTGTDLVAVLAATPEGGEVRVCAGTWPGPVELSGDRQLHGMSAVAGTVVIDAGGAGTALWIKDGSAHVSGLTLTGGAAERGGALRVSSTAAVVIDAVELLDSMATWGGGLYVDVDADVTLRAVSVRGTSATEGGGAWLGGDVAWSGGEVTGADADRGGGLVVATGATLIASGLDVHDNTAVAQGGVRVDGTLQADGSGFQDNVAETSGGGIGVLSGGTAVLRWSSVDGNRAGSGGGAYVGAGGALDVRSVGFANNLAADGGALWVSGSGSFSGTEITFLTSTATGTGGAVRSDGTFTLSTSAFTDGLSDEGGGLYVGGGVATLTDVAFSGNEATRGGALVAGGRVTLTRVSVEDNAGDDGAGVLVDGVGAAIPSLSWTGGSLRDNVATERGGGLRVASGVSGVVVTQVEIAGNAALEGGGVWVGLGSRAMFSDLAIDGNDAPTGAGIYTLGDVSLDTCHVRRNQGSKGGGAYLQGGFVRSTDVEWTPFRWDNGPNDVQTSQGATWSGSLVATMVCDVTGCR